MRANHEIALCIPLDWVDKKILFTEEICLHRCLYANILQELSCSVITESLLQVKHLSYLSELQTLFINN